MPVFFGEGLTLQVLDQGNRSTEGSGGGQIYTWTSSPVVDGVSPASSLAAWERLAPISFVTLHYKGRFANQFYTRVVVPQDLTKCCEETDRTVRGLLSLVQPQREALSSNREALSSNTVDIPLNGQTCVEDFLKSCERLGSCLWSWVQSVEVCAKKGAWNVTDDMLRTLLDAGGRLVELEEAMRPVFERLAVQSKAVEPSSGGVPVRLELVEKLEDLNLRLLGTLVGYPSRLEWLRAHLPPGSDTAEDPKEIALAA